MEINVKKLNIYSKQNILENLLNKYVDNIKKEILNDNERIKLISKTENGFIVLIEEKEL